MIDANEELDFLRSYLTLVESYIELLRQKQNIFNPSQERDSMIEELRTKLLSGQARVQRHIGSVEYMQFGMRNTAWAGISHAPFSPTADMGFIRDALIAKIGELEHGGVNRSNSNSQTLYVRSSPLYWTLTSWSLIRNFVHQFSWSSLLSKTAATVYVVAALLTIIGFFVT